MDSIVKSTFRFLIVASKNSKAEIMFELSESICYIISLMNDFFI